MSTFNTKLLISGYKHGNDAAILEGADQLLYISRCSLLRCCSFFPPFFFIKKNKTNNYLFFFFCSPFPPYVYETFLLFSHSPSPHNSIYLPVGLILPPCIFQLIANTKSIIYNYYTGFIFAIHQFKECRYAF